jgi:hypothetical protein
MNSPKRLIFGVLSCLLLATGFAQAADRIDPMTNGVPLTSKGRSERLGSWNDIPTPCLSCNLSGQKLADK